MSRTIPCSVLIPYSDLSLCSLVTVFSLPNFNIPSTEILFRHLDTLVWNLNERAGAEVIIFFSIIHSIKNVRRFDITGLNKNDLGQKCW